MMGELELLRNKLYVKIFTAIIYFWMRKKSHDFQRIFLHTLAVFYVFDEKI